MQDAPLDELATRYGCALLHEVRRRYTSNQRHQGQDAVRPLEADLANHSINDGAVGSTTEAAARKDEAIGETATGAKVLRGDGRDDLYTHISNQPYILHSPDSLVHLQQRQRWLQHHRGSQK